MKKKLSEHLQQFFLLFSLLATGTLSARSPDTTIFRDDFDRASLGTFWKASPEWSIVNNSAYSFIDGQIRHKRKTC